MVGVRVPVNFDGDFGALMGGLERSLSGAGKALGAGLTRDINGRLRDVRGRFVAEGTRIGQDGGTAIGRGLVSRLRDTVGGTALSGVTRVLGRTLQAGAAAAGVGAAAAIGVSLTKGFGRLVAIDTATAKLTGLGNSAETVEKVMDNALASVRGTAFGLGDAATVAAGAMAAGIKPGQDLERTLKLTADAATIGGSSLSEMGAIFNKVAASGKIQGDVIAQLGDQGIPILQLLGKEIGKTPAEVSELASKGKIDFATFQNAMEAGLGGAALESGKTFTGALANVGAAMGRLGASVIGGVFPQIKDVFGDLTAALDSMGPAAEKVGTVLGAGFAAAYPIIRDIGIAIGEFFTGPTFAAITTAFAGIGTALSPAITAVGTAFGTIATELSPLIAQLAPLIAQTSPLLGLFQALAPLLPAVAEAIGGLLTTALSHVAPLLAQLAAVMSGTLIPAITALATGALPVFNALLGLAAGLIPPITTVISTLIPVVAQLIEAILPVMLELFAAIVPIITALTPVIVQLATAIAGGLSQALLALVPVVTQVISALLPVMLAILSAIVPIINVLAPIIAFLGNVIATVLTAAIENLIPAILPVVGIFGTLGNDATNLWEQYLKPAFAAIGVAFQAVGTAFVAVGAAISTAFTAVVTAFQVAGAAIATAFGAVVTAFQIAGTAISTAFTAVVGAFQIAGAAIATAFTAVLSAFQIVGAAIGAVFTAIGTALTAVWTGFISPIFEFIGASFALVGAGFALIYDTAIQPIFDLFALGVQTLNDTVAVIFAAIGTAFAFVGSGFVLVYDTAIQPLFDTFALGVQVLKDAVAIIFEAISTAFAFVGSGFVAIYNTVIQPLLDTFDTGVTNLKAGLAIIFTAIGTAFAAIGTAFKTAYNTVIQPILDTFDAGVDTLKTVLSLTFKAIGDAFESIGDVFEDVVNNVIDPIFTTFGDIIGKIPGKFDEAVEAIGKAWDGLQEIAKKPIDFVVQTVINNGLIKGFNFLAGILGTTPMNTIPWPPPGWQSGGFTGNAPVSAPVGFVHGKEWVINAGSTKKFEDKFPGYLRHINATGTLPGYKIGGFVGSEGGGSAITSWRGFQFTQEFARRLQAVQKILGTTLAITQGGFRPQTSYSGTSHRGDAVDIARPFDLRTIAALRSVGIAAWDRSGKGNWIDHIHGVPLPGAGRAGGSGVWQAQDYLRGGDGLGGQDTGPRGGLLKDIAGLANDALAVITDLPGALTDKFAAPLARLGEISDTPFGKMVAAVPNLLKEGFLDKVKELAPFDNGGFLNPGFTPAINNTGKPEAVLTNEQWRILRGNLDGGGQRSGGITYAPTFNNRQSGAAQLQELDWVLRFHGNGGSGEGGLT